MKKYILSLAILVFVFSLLTVSADFVRAYECEPGHLFSILTGKPCSDVLQQNYYTSSQDLKIGSRGENVKEFQQILKDEGFLYGRVDGIFGRMTDGAANKYYKKYPCYLGASTVDIIRRICPPTPINTNAPTISGVSGPQTLNVNQTGTWTVTAYDVVGGGNLSYTVVWGDEVYYSGAVNASQKPAQQSAAFTHSYATAGTYNPTFTVTNKYGQSAKTSLSVVVGNVNPPTPTDSITVLSPNGGETWIKGTTQTITWQNKTSDVSKTYDIILQSTCAGYVCTDVYRPSYIIARNVYSSSSNFQGSYAWSVGYTVNSGTAPDGAYLIKICESDTSVCDFSDKYFMVSSSTVSPLTITTPSVLTNAKVGQPYSVALTASGGAGSSSGYSWGAGTRAGFPVSGLGLSSSFGNPIYITGTPAKVYVNGFEQMVPYTFTFNVTVNTGYESTVKTFNLTVDPATTTNTTPTISYLSPTYGPVGTTVTVTGSGFSTTGNKIRFGNLGVENSPSYNNLISSDGTHLTFTVPYSNYMACWDSHPACMVAAYTTAPGMYAVSVINSSGKASNELSFTVTQ